MRLSNQILTWFNEEGSFFDGLQLYKLGNGPNVNQLEACLNLNYVPDQNWQILNSFLGDYLASNPASEIDLAEEVISPPDLPIQKVEPTSILELRKQAKMLHKKQAFLHAQLSVVQTSEDRYELASEIMEKVIPALDAKYDAIRDWEATGEEPTLAQHNDLVQDTIQKFQRTLSLAPRISKLKGWLDGGKSLTDIQRQKYEKELLEKEVELQELKEELFLY